MNLEKYKYIAHRGLHSSENKIFENTLEAFENAIKNNFAIELDVQLTKDDKIVVFHDFDALRMTGKKTYIKDMNISEVQKLKIKNSNSYIPTLDEVLHLVSGKVPLLIEVKNEGKVGKLEKILKERLEKYNGDFLVESFNPFVVMYYKKKTDFFTGWLVCKKHTMLKGKILSFFSNCIISLNILNPDFIAYKYDEMSKKAYNIIKKRNLPLLFWTIKNNETVKDAFKIGDGIIFENILPK